MWIQRRGASLSQRSSGKMQVDVQWHQKARDHGKCANIVSRLPLYLTICFACCHFRSRVLKHLYSDESVYKDYDLVVVGHSLGGGCAQVLSLMLRPSFPSLRCFAYEPPVRLFSFWTYLLYSFIELIELVLRSSLAGMHLWRFVVWRLQGMDNFSCQTRRRRSVEDIILLPRMTYFSEQLLLLYFCTSAKSYPAQSRETTWWILWRRCAHQSSKVPSVSCTS